jgi:(2R)-sulfolactate sulfo-lyase subunit alpha
MQPGILVHMEKDDVGVAVFDIEIGLEIGAASLDGKPAGAITMIENVPLGHKVALRDIEENETILEYGNAIGRATQFIRRGSHVHVHNIKSLRW